MIQRIENIINKKLLSDEKIIWWGKPERKRIFSKSNIFIRIFMAIGILIIFGFILYLLLKSGIILFPFNFSDKDSIPFLILCLALPIIAFILLYSSYYSFKKANETYYVITNKRCWTLSPNLILKKILYFDKDDLGVIEIREKPSGSGDLTVLDRNVLASIIEWVGISDIRKVEKIIRDNFK